MRAGELKEVIRIDRCVKVVNDYGEEVEKWAFFKFYRCDVVQKLGNVSEEANIVRASGGVEFRCRWYVNIRIGDRITYAGEFYRVVGKSRNKKLMMITFAAELDL